MGKIKFLAPVETLREDRRESDNGYEDESLESPKMANVSLNQKSLRTFTQKNKAKFVKEHTDDLFSDYEQSNHSKKRYPSK